ncbi:hypothetical protein GCM10010302_17710 [Streptomyces polychromogenes]|uniref:Uncharacterized protein n=1 Tax=Streptomyces polychromogenes TaxID=67342 RepID=A0ABN0V884_9ACTN
MALDRYGDYRVVFEADRDQVPVFTAHGTWVGLAGNPDAPAAAVSSGRFTVRPLETWRRPRARG